MVGGCSSGSEPLCAVAYVRHAVGVVTAAAEAAVALAIVIALFRHRGTLDVQDADSLQG